MELFPAVDIRGGRVTHVRTGATGEPAPSVYGEDPAGAVAGLAGQGARWVHLVDLDRAFGTGTNRDMVRSLLAIAPVKIQIGGALGSEAAIADMLACGAARVVIGCGAAASEPGLVGRLVRRHGPDRLAVGVDVRDGLVAPRTGPGVAPPPLAVDHFVRRVHEEGAGTVVYTDVARDGTLAGPDINGAREMTALGLEVIAGGGVGSLDDLRAVRRAGLAGAIVGRALHEGRFTLAEALACVTA